MSRQTVILLSALLLAVLPALPALAAGTSADTGAISNGYFSTGDTIPKTYGRVSVGYFKSSSLADSKYTGPSTADTVIVDTGYDLTLLSNLTQKTGAPGDTVIFVYWIENLGNATYRIDFDTRRSVGTGFNDTNWGQDEFDIYYDLGNDSSIAGDSSDLTNMKLPPGNSRQILVVGRIPTTATDNDSSHIVLYVTDNAVPYQSGAAGDSWEAGIPLLTGNGDARDTMADTVIVQVTGPNVLVSKDVYAKTDTRARPGDTLICDITFDNDGADSARGAELMDAIPQFTRFIKRTADSGIYLGNSNQTPTTAGDTDILIYFDSEALGATPTWQCTEGMQSDTNNVVVRIRWSMKTAIGETNGDAISTVEFNNGVYDNGRVSYRVVIE